MIGAKIVSVGSWGVMVVALLAVTTLATPVRIVGQSMEPTLQSGTWILVSPALAAARAPQHDDLVVAHHPSPDGGYIIKRVVGVPGDCVAIQEGRVSRNGQWQAEPFVHSPAHYSVPLRCLTQDEYFVMGDNRAASVDSATWGPLPRSAIAGAVLLHGIIPPADAGAIPTER